MKINDLADRILESVKAGIAELDKERGTEIGVIPAELLMKYQAFEVFREAVEADYSKRAEEIKDAVHNKLLLEFGDRLDEIEAKHAEIWEAIYEELGIVDKAATHKINPETGLVSKVDKRKNLDDLEVQIIVKPKGGKQRERDNDNSRH